jgi:hypothetical protein
MNVRLLLLAASVGILFAVIDKVSAVGFLAMLIAGWEIALGFWLVLKGFNDVAVDRLYASVRSVELVEAR